MAMPIRPTGAADAAVVHLKDLLLGVDDEAVVDPDLAVPAGGERAGGCVFCEKWPAAVARAHWKRPTRPTPARPTTAQAQQPHQLGKKTQTLNPK
jgi:hypothetical protein